LKPVTFTVETATSTCQWSSVPTGVPSWVDWLSFLPITDAVGPRVVSLAYVWYNNDGSPRTRTLTIGGKTVTVIQAGNSCPLTVPRYPPGVPMPASGGLGTFTVFTDRPSCSYSVRAGEGVTIVSGGTGTSFPATVTFSIPPNFTGAGTSYALSVSSNQGFGPTVPTVSIVQSGAAVTTDAPSQIGFAVRRGLSAPPHVTAPEPVRLTNGLSPNAAWTATATAPWIVTTPNMGATPAVMEISIDAAATAGLAAGFHEGKVNFTSPIAPLAPTSVPVFLFLTDSTTTTYPPLGALDTPVTNTSGLSGAVPVGAWAADDVGIKRVQIFRSPAAGESASEIYLGDATRVRGARPDILAYLSSPEVTRAGWGLMLLSNVLPNGGTGTFALSAYAEDIEGNRSLLGRTTVSFDNTSSPYPFGTIDVPSQGGSISGTTAAIQGWVLAQPGRSIATDGSTIRLYIDGVQQPQAASYGYARPDVASFFPFPTYANANGPAAQFVVDSTQFANGMHTMAWVAVDDHGVAQGLGSRYFTIDNGVGSQVAEPSSTASRSAAAVRALPSSGAFVWNRRGFDDRPWALEWSGARTAEIQHQPGERLQVSLDTWWWSSGCGPYEGYLLTGDLASPLPTGASLDGETGVFSWMPPAEFGGSFEFAFVRRACVGGEVRVPLRVVIQPR
jgi:hypothetical protein